MCVRRLYENEIPFPLDWLINLETAINGVNERYCRYEYQNRFQKRERVFAYELYHQFRNLLADNDNEEDYRFDGEIGKVIYGALEICGVDPDLLINAGERRNFDQQTSFSPDMVFHLNQNDRLQDNQKLIVEIKTKKVGDRDLVRDILKLNHYIRVLNFQYAVLISVNTDFEELENQIRAIVPYPDDINLQERFRRIIVFNYADRIQRTRHLLNILRRN